MSNLKFRDPSEWANFDRKDEAVLLLVDYTDGDHALADDQIAVTIGHNNDHNVGDDEGNGWEFAGWCWTQDCYTQGSGVVIGWCPLSEAHDYAASISPTNGDPA